MSTIKQRVVQVITKIDNTYGQDVHMVDGWYLGVTYKVKVRRGHATVVTSSHAQDGFIYHAIREMDSTSVQALQSIINKAVRASEYLATAADVLTENGYEVFPSASHGLTATDTQGRGVYVPGDGSGVICPVHPEHAGAVRGVVSALPSWSEV